MSTSNRFEMEAFYHHIRRPLTRVTARSSTELNRYISKPWRLKEMQELLCDKLFTKITAGIACPENIRKEAERHEH